MSAILKSDQLKFQSEELYSLLAIFAPFFFMVPLDAKKLTRLPKNTLEIPDDEMIDSMSLHFFCTIS
jgi:hypothetical protein